MTLDVADRIACAICWLARQRGLPSSTVAMAVLERHPGSCGWCDYPLAELLSMARLPDDSLVSAFRRLPAKSQRRLVDQSLAIVA